ncbi:sialidase family protein [Streptomyces europaeiscabiei]|uniref:Sialidase family protein n=1 Tax=Streptomyces europaeiscabiei TaxID=146819 RepID=A0ABU4NSW5_9ACTN|nr:sialidase family protein [Streptomyces europaeiscabiei]MDX2531243.1 sialidase family protein [Streptomyces europaeiscabiei]MDX2758727.1 sialidase family protein [Streptomyces europaeiscabiei]MDX2769932.1 sialidase family protein [Streptomyces europaeiscabiei]MDX3547700.1 sialidase family protein [Streptomyces europaeiscabiei]MDX3557177.1 sialidase family protein [Streptomyces europaeiscabiei]
MSVHRLRALLGTVAAVLLLTACVVDPAGGSAGNSVRPGQTAVTSPRIPSASTLPGWSHSLGFAADGSGFALLAECTDERCRQHVAVLDTDAGKWRLAKSPLPDVKGDLGITAGLHVLGAGRAVIIDQHEDWSRPGPTWFTRDGGRTWAVGTQKPQGTTATVPPGGLLVDECVELDASDPANTCARNRLLVVMPDTGEHVVLERQPPLKGLLAPSGDVARNALFVSGEDPESGLPTQARSEDRGRTWQLTDMPGAAKEGWGFQVVAGRDGLYAQQTGRLPDHEEVKNGLRALHTSTDGGHTWTRLWTYRRGVEPLSSLGDVVAADDGSLTVYGENGVWRSTDRARTFQRARGSHGAAGSVTSTPIGWLWADSYGNGHYRISTDGIHWQEFTVGSD